jgi:hypothetical protein
VTTTLAKHRLYYGQAVYTIYRARKYRVVFIGAYIAITMCGHVIPIHRRVWYSD